MATATPGAHTRVEEGRSLLERPKTSRIAFQTTDLSKVYHHLRRQRPRRLQVDTKIYHSDGSTSGDTHGKTTRNLQSAIVLNVLEARYCALCHDAAHGVALAAYLRDPVELRKDSLERDHIEKLNVREPR